MLKVPAIDIAEVGAGGGSLAGIDQGGLLVVGPQSAGAMPGPACYGLGNDRPTVTDANVVLGFINPNFAFNPLVSFQVVIMAFLGGLQRLWGPVLGVVPLIILSEGLQTEFPFWFSILLGLVFMVIVYFLPRGVTGLLEDGWAALGRPLEWPRGVTGPLIDAWAWLSRPVVLPRGIAGAIEDIWVKIAPRANEKR